MLFMNRCHKLYCAPDEKSGGVSTADAAGAETGSSQAAKTADGDAQTSLGSQAQFTQSDLDRILADRLARQEKKLRREFEQAAEKQTEEELAAAAEWQTLAEKRQRQIHKLEEEKTTLEQQAETAVRYGKALQTYVQQLSEGLPAPILTLLEGMDEAAKLEWLTANATQFTGSQTDTPATSEGGPPPTPAPDTGEEVSAEQRRSQAYFPHL